MRSFLAFVALVIGFVAATVAVVAYVAHETVLEPSNAGQVLAQAVEDEDIRDQILSEAVPGYDQLPAAARDQVDQVAESASVDRVLEGLQADEAGQVDLTPVREELAGQLRDAGFGRVATQVEEATGIPEIAIPERYWDPYTSARATSWTVTTWAAGAAVVAFVLALLVARNRRTTLAGVGVAVMLSAAAAFGLLWLAPELAQRTGADRWVQVGVAGLDPTESFARTTLIAVAVAGLVLLLLSFAVPRPRPK